MKSIVLSALVVLLAGTGGLACSSGSSDAPPDASVPSEGGGGPGEVIGTCTPTPGFAGNAKHVGAPMPGTIGTVSARVGQTLARGDTLLTLEAMKMETTVRAEQDGVIKEVLAKPGQAVDAKDLLVIFD